MREDYRNNNAFRTIVKKLMALPFLPQHFIRDGFTIIQREAENQGVVGQLAELFHYFQQQWLRG